VDRDAFDALVADLDYPMYVVTAAADHGSARDGCLVGFASQASIDPPRLLVLLSKANRTYRLACRSEALVVHFLHRGNGALAARFGEETGDEVDKFAGCSWRPGPHGIPVLDGTRGWVAGGVLDRLDAGDHVAHLLEILEAGVDVPGPPLGYQEVRGMEPGHPA
jgi:flavin reductase (DIM6/NTAB) family NADH-FMN oxidoreductase RutF